MMAPEHKDRQHAGQYPITHKLKQFNLRSILS
jgi:hypothetical protein